MTRRLYRLIDRQEDNIKYLLFVCALLFLCVLFLLWFAIHQETFFTGEYANDLLANIIPNFIPIFLGFSGWYLIFFRVDDVNEDRRKENLSQAVAQKVVEKIHDETNEKKRNESLSQAVAQKVIEQIQQLFFEGKLYPNSSSCSGVDLARSGGKGKGLTVSRPSDPNLIIFLNS